MGFDPASIGSEFVTSVAGESAGLAASSAGAYGPIASASTLLPSAGSISSIAGLAGSALSAVGSVRQGQQQANAANFNAAVAANNAQLATQNATTAGQVGAEETAITQQKTRAEVGAIKAAQAANGIDINSGSAVDVRSSASELGELNAITIRGNAARTAYGYQTQARSDEANANLLRQEANYDTEAGDTKAATTLLSSGVSGSQSGLWNGFLKSQSINGGG